MSFALPAAMRDYIVARASDGSYGNTSEYIRDLVRKDQVEQASARMREAIATGLASGPATPRDSTDEDELRAIAQGRVA